ncbi:lysophospholipid acyltransferase family protein [Mammaliicoccus sciuri]|uniref:lysophospholipid acyltransferase family protein n=1 Tax=Mammaliicoccus sciuri TaxID=1296 RepID=UPI000D1ED9B6|nr:lysophospholipid acyltransferase family protein [Mammaliicoccus sciuri]MCD8895464.1 1-acyl-sn-glycerol-3-phosphate acyltransferase [Mammaliicoccus sciuri]MCD8913578.1 1-acyl-sn-glycerol-3-phosphate acyltransferase [Mammaliicoccus sciuri]MCJ0952793.1 1-acyl-sn-glycerol-3-phosphate acyltransferase [Mammaliicoccus sciuri]MCY1028384.1 lysophospholipid acyltransferase family protein [Mammaliicoccus sciuri]PTJ49265.1 1-acyl-sn-glycerol-3-phosphate acyltransferase [Mammaliicoccus sciuri]
MLRLIIFTCIIKPIILIVLGLNIRRREWLPKKGPIVIIANHNSHLDTLVLLSLFQGEGFKKARPVAAGDYFLKNKLLKWFSMNVMRIIPIERKMTRDIKGLFEPIVDALDEGSIIILYPEGSRGEPEKLSKYKSGIYYLMRERPNIPIQPLFLHGLGKSLPKGSKLFVPFFVDIFVGRPFLFNENRKVFMDELNERMNELRNEGDFKEW